MFKWFKWFKWFKKILCKHEFELVTVTDWYKEEQCKICHKTQSYSKNGMYAKWQKH